MHARIPHFGINTVNPDQTTQFLSVASFIAKAKEKQKHRVFGRRFLGFQL